MRKICRDCRIEKDLSEFSSQKGKYFRAQCKVCDYEKRKKPVPEIVDLPNEEWIDATGFSNFMVSNKGRFKTKGMSMIRSNGAVFKTRPQIIKQSIGTTGYHSVWVNGDNGYKNARIHRLVALAFIPNPNNLPQVNHIDGNKLNNSIENLEWVTNKENAIHAHAMGLSTVPKKLNEQQVSDIKANYPDLSIRELATLYNVHYYTIHAIVNGVNWKHISPTNLTAKA